MLDDKHMHIKNIYFLINIFIKFESKLPNCMRIEGMVVNRLNISHYSSYINPWTIGDSKASSNDMKDAI